MTKLSLIAVALDLQALAAALLLRQQHALLDQSWNLLAWQEWARDRMDVSNLKPRL